MAKCFVPSLVATLLAVILVRPADAAYRDVVLGLDPVGYWEFEDLSDSSGNGNTLSTTGDAGLAPGPFGMAADLPGTSSIPNPIVEGWVSEHNDGFYVDTPAGDPLNFTDNEYSIVVWFQPKFNKDFRNNPNGEQSGTMVLVQKRRGPTWEGDWWDYGIWLAGHVEDDVIAYAYQVAMIDAPPPPTPNLLIVDASQHRLPVGLAGQWHMAGVSWRKGVGTTFYLDGEVHSTTADLNDAILTGSDHRLLIGNRAGPGDDAQGDAFVGALDEVAIFNDALTDSDMAGLFAAAEPSGPIESTWAVDRSGDWTSHSNWSSFAPSGNQSTAIFGEAISVKKSVRVDSPITIRSIQFDPTNQSGTKPFYVITGSGEVTLEADAGNASIDVDSGDNQFQTEVSLNSETDVDIAIGASLAFNNELHLNGHALNKNGNGELSINNHLDTGGGSVNGLGGLITGSGTIEGLLNNAGGTVAPGNSPGVLEIRGDYTQGENAELAIEIANTRAGIGHDVLVVSGTAELDGALMVTLLDGFTPTDGDRFDILDFTSLSGQFDTLTLPDLTKGLAWDPAGLYTSGTLAITSIPEPSTIVLLALGLLTMRKRFGIRFRTPFVVCGVAVIGITFTSPSAQVAEGAAFADKTSQVIPGILGRYGPGGHQRASWGDYNRDGYVDLWLDDAIWRNNEGANFTPEFDPLSGGPQITHSYFALWGDYNNDGWLDILSSHVLDGLSLFRNNSGNSFSSVALPGGLPELRSRGASWADHDGDGDIDLYVGGFENFGVATFNDIRLRNNGGSFSHVWTGNSLAARGVTSADFDRDADIDIFVSDYRLHPNVLWVNDSLGNFSNLAVSKGVAGIDDANTGEWGHTIGSAWGDLDNDGEIDLFTGNFAHPPANQDRSKFYRNRGPSQNYTFEDKGELGLPYAETYASPVFGDYDNDGDLDLFITTVNSTGSFPNEASVLYRNNGNWSFTDVTAQEGLANIRQTVTAAFADYDNDGDLDLVSGGALYQNQGNSNHWLKVRLEGDGLEVSRDAVGAQVRIQVGGETLLRQVEFGTGEGNQNDPTLHFGLGSSVGTVVNLEVFWPNGEVQVESLVPIDTTQTIQFNPVPITERTWKQDASGDWHNPLNWSPSGVPSGNDITAVLDGNAPTARTITADIPFFIKTVLFNSASGYVIGGAGRLKTQAATGNASLDVMQGDHELQVEVRLTSETDVNVINGSLAFENVLDLNGRTLNVHGDVQINNNLVDPSGGTANVLSGRLSGGGRVNGDLTNSAIVAPGKSAGTMTVAGNYDQDASSLLKIEIGGQVQGNQFDLLKVLGDVSLDGGLGIQLIGGFMLTAGQQFEIIDAGGTLSGTFTGLPGGSVIETFDNIDLVIDYNGGDGNDVVLTAGRLILGDMDCDGDVDFDDIDPFVLGLNDPQAYEDQFGVPPILKGDTDGDDDLDFDDIPGFVAAISGGGGVQSVPEPSTAMLLFVALLQMALVLRCTSGLSTSN